jgi:hypothetical protein
MNKIQIFILILIVVAFVLGGTFLLSTVAKPALLPDFAATVQRDCAPWDGPAFTVNVPLNDGRAVSISIWQEPALGGPLSFTFPDTSGQVGNASVFPANGIPEELSGTVSFQSVQANHPVQGRFDLVDQNGEHFKGSFDATWTDVTMLCG